MPAGLLTIIVVSLLTKAPSQQIQEFVDHVRYPNIKGSPREGAPAYMGGH